MNATLLPAPLYSKEEEQAFLAEIYAELDSTGHIWPELTAAEADELERLSNCHGRPHEL